jgi:hypothetical protein
MTPEESSVFFNLLSGPASDPAGRWIDFMLDPRAANWDQGITKSYIHADYIAQDLQEHARGCNLPIAECRLCRLCELEIKRRWPDLCRSKWPGATADETHEFTDLEFEVIFENFRGVPGVPSEEIAQQCGITVIIVMTILSGIYDKAGLSSRWELYKFVKTALSGELRRRAYDFTDQECEVIFTNPGSSDPGKVVLEPLPVLEEVPRPWGKAGRQDASFYIKEVRSGQTIGSIDAFLEGDTATLERMNIYEEANPSKGLGSEAYKQWESALPKSIKRVTLNASG